MSLRTSLNAVLAGFCALAMGSCSADNGATSEVAASTVESCPTLSGTAWVPNVTGASASNHDSTVTISKTSSTVTGAPVIGLEQAAPSSKETSVTIDMSTDLGTNGSLSLVAEVSNLSSIISGGAYPLLVSLVDSNGKDWVNLARSGASGDCANAGYFTCSSGSCVSKSTCAPSWPTAFTDRKHWEQHQIPTFGYNSVNTFPTCDWNDGDSSAPTGSTSPQCAFNQSFFVSGKMPTGTYTAKYVLVAEYSSLSGYNVTGDLKVTVVKKSDATSGGTMDLNVILVGDKNVVASRTDKGKQNLDALFEEVSSIYSAAGISLGTVTAYEWSCDSGGDDYTDVNADDLGTMFTASKTLLGTNTEAKALNVFIVSTIPYSSSSGLTILGISGGIGGSMLNGSAISGLAFSSFDELDSYNPNCTPGSSCPKSSQEADFVDMGSTIAHEIGHYLGLNHPSESGGTTHDVVYDTPKCTTTSSSGYITNSTCRLTDTNVYQPTSLKCSDVCTSYSNSSGTYCPTALECQFNHTMWWTSKNFKEGTSNGDGNLFSTGSKSVMNFNPFIQ